jgi:metal-responsive CopG/Arc/MetJ family transcriptional regulator
VKIAVSIPTLLFEAAERKARKLGVSRSQLYAEALQRMLEGDREAEVTAQLNEVYAVEDSSLDPAWAEAQRRATAEMWQ